MSGQQAVVILLSILIDLLIKIKSYKMKKSTCFFIVLLSTITCFQGPLIAQNMIKQPSFDIQKSFLLTVENVSVLNSPSKMGDRITSTENFNIKCIRDFHVRYNQVDNTQWFATPEGYQAYFIQGEFGNRAFYDKNGDWVDSILT
jgi:hypothetical protein